MTKTPERPQAGGSYTRDPKTGKLKRTEFTRPAPSRSEAAAAAKKAEIAKPADEKGALSDG
jgi:hypothetical protein